MRQRSQTGPWVHIATGHVIKAFHVSFLKICYWACSRWLTWAEEQNSRTVKPSLFVEKEGVFLLFVFAVPITVSV